MKKSELKQIIKEELQKSLKETNGKKQTAVKGLVDIVERYIENLSEDDLENLSNLFEQAKQIEKEQIENAYDMGYLDYQNLTHDSAQDYYNETYK
jgi:cytochrome c553